MPRFAKQSNCPTSDTLTSFAAGTLSPLARQGVGQHLRCCDFCAAELCLHERAGGDETDAPRAAADETDAPPMPFALRLFAESCLSEIARSAAAPRRRAA